MTTIQNRYDFVLLFDVKNGNPNGDPDMDNMPRVDPETGHGLVTDVCLKRKIRNYITLHGQKSNLEEEIQNFIFVQEGNVLNQKIKDAHDSIRQKLQKNEKEYQELFNKNPKEYIQMAQHYMCKNYFDIRTFGAVLSTTETDKQDKHNYEVEQKEKKDNSKNKKTHAGQVRGAVQLTFGQSEDILPISSHTLTVTAGRTGLDDIGIQGRKHTVPYALYRSHGFISAAFAHKTGFSDADLTLFWEAVERMFWEDHSAARGDMNVRGLYVFKHDSKLGNAAAHELFDKITIQKNTEIETPRAFDDYTVSVDTRKTEGVELIDMLKKVA